MAELPTTDFLSRLFDIKSSRCLRNGISTALGVTPIAPRRSFRCLVQEGNCFRAGLADFILQDYDLLPVFVHCASRQVGKIIECNIQAIYSPKLSDTFWK